MANTTPEENKATTPVQGAGGAAESAGQTQSGQHTAETPEWVRSILDSNKAVLESNQLVIDAIGEFKETAGEVFADAVKHVTQNVGTDNGKAEVEPVEIDPKAKYVVAKDASFRDSKDFNKVYKSGDDVTDFEEGRLKHLVSIGHVVKKSK